MLVAELEHRRGETKLAPRCLERELWALTPHLYAVNSRPDLMANIGRAIAKGCWHFLLRSNHAVHGGRGPPAAGLRHPRISVVGGAYFSLLRTLL